MIPHASLTALGCTAAQLPPHAISALLPARTCLHRQSSTSSFIFFPLVLQPATSQPGLNAKLERHKKNVDSDLRSLSSSSSSNYLDTAVLRTLSRWPSEVEVASLLLFGVFFFELPLDKSFKW